MPGRLILFYMHDLSGGGVERMRLALIAELRARGIHVKLVLGRLAGPLISLLPSDLDVIQLHAGTTVGSIIPLARVIRQLRPDFIISSLDHNNIAAMLATRIARVDTRVVICQHNALSAEAALGWKYRAVPWLYWLFQRWAHGMVAVSQGVADDLAAAAGIAPCRITRIYNPVIGQDFSSRAKPYPSGPKPPASGPVNFVFVGRLTEQKNPALLLAAFALLDDALQARLIVVGDGPLLDELRAQASRLAIRSRVIFCGFQANPLPWIKHANCLVLTSRYEGFANVLIEALACGTPVVATDCPHGPREALADGAFGELVPCDNPRLLAEAMQRAVQVEPDRDRLRSRAALFTASACADEHLALFARLEANGSRHIRPFGLNFSTLSVSGVVHSMLTQPAKDDLRLVVTPNIDHVRLLRQAAFSAAYHAAHLICPDGFPILAYARLRGVALRARVTGCELFRCLADSPAFSMKRICLVVESTPTERAARRWAKAHGLVNISVVTAPAGLVADREGQLRLVEAIRAACPDILVMTLGAPVSEIFVHRHRHDLPPCWAICVGQALRVYLGLAKRAPCAWQNLGLEWLWRLIQEPRRLAGRYSRASFWFAFAVLRDLLMPTRQEIATSEAKQGLLF